MKNNWEQVERSFGIFQGIPTVVGSLEHLCDVASKKRRRTIFSAHAVSPASTARCDSRSKRIERCVATKSAQANNLAAFLGATPIAI